MPDKVARSLAQCIGCHDQCMFASAEVIHSGRQELVASRLASSVRDVLAGTQPLDGFLLDALFMALDQGAQQQSCIILDGSQDPRTWLRWAREEFGRRSGRIPEPVAELRTVRAAAETGAPVAPGDGDVVVVRDGVTSPLNPAGAESMLALLRRRGFCPVEVVIPSSGTLEHFYGLPQEARQATLAAVEALRTAGDRPLVTDDPAVVYAARRIWPGFVPAPTVLHLAEFLTSGDAATPDGPIVTIDDVGLMARDLGISEEIRGLLLAHGYRIAEPVTSGVAARDDGPMLGYPDAALRERIGHARYQELLDTGAELIVTCAPWSHRNLPGDGPVPIRDLASVLADATLPRGVPA